MKGTIALGADHGGYALKEVVKEFLRSEGYEVLDVGTFDETSVDYPDFAEKVARAVLAGEAQRGILLCGTGIGMSIAANKIPGIRAAHVQDPYSARMARAHNDANILTFGGRVVGPELAKEIVRAYLTAEFEGGRHVRRLEKIRTLEEGRKEA